jgi:hypothetical protein
VCVPHSASPSTSHAPRPRSPCALGHWPATVATEQHAIFITSILLDSLLTTSTDAFCLWASGFDTQVITSANCTGNERSLEECDITIVPRSSGAAQCAPGSAVGISCINAGGLPQDAESVGRECCLSASRSSRAQGHVTRASQQYAPAVPPTRFAMFTRAHCVMPLPYSRV